MVFSQVLFSFSKHGAPFLTAQSCYLSIGSYFAIKNAQKKIRARTAPDGARIAGCSRHGRGGDSACHTEGRGGGGVYHTEDARKGRREAALILSLTGPADFAACFMR